MRFGVPDSDDEDLISLSYTSDEHESPDKAGQHVPCSSLGKTIRQYIETSDSEVNSEDEVDLLGGGWDVAKPKADTDWGESKVVTPKSPRSNSKSKRQLPSNQRQASAGPSRIKPRSAPFLLFTDQIDQTSEYDHWLRMTEAAAMREGQQAALNRRGELKQITMHAREEVWNEEEQRAAREEEEMRRLLDALAIRQTREEEEMSRRFEERKRQLWAEIDTAIKEVERKEAEVKLAAQAAIRRKQQEDAAKAAAAQKLTEAKRVEEERKAKEEADKARAAAEAEAATGRKVAAEKAKKEEQERAAASKGQAGGEWRKWVDIQRKMKADVIEVVKSDRATKANLRTGMRLITRGLGQVVNTREAVTRVSNDIHKILCENLPAAPSASSPIRFNLKTPRLYAYLLSHTSKALIKQAESEVSAKADAAFPLARIIVLLLLHGHSALGEVLFARLVKKCPWVVPHYPGRQPNQPREEYEKSTGRGMDESIGDYTSRMAGIATLYLAILQTPLASLTSTLPQAPAVNQLPDLIHSVLRFPVTWSWLAQLLREPFPGLPPTAHLVSVWIEIVGAEAIRQYGPTQVGKMFEAITREGLQGGKLKGDSEAARQRLGLLLQDWRGSLKPHPAREWT